MTLFVWGCNRQPAKREKQQHLGSIDKTKQEITESADFIHVEGNPGVYLFDSVTKSSEMLSGTNLPPFSIWRNVASDITTYEFKGDTAILNNRVTAIIRASGYGVDLYTLSKTGAVFRCTVSPVSEVKKQIKGTPTIIIHENSTAAVKLGVEYKSDNKTVGFNIRLSAGESGIEVGHGQGMKWTCIEAQIQYVIVPNFFAGDMIFTGVEGNSKEILLPAEHMLLSLTDAGNNIIMCTWTGTNQEVRCTKIYTNNISVIKQIEISPTTTSPIWIMFMEDQGIWFENVPNIPAKSWQTPFQARWRINLLDSTPFADSHEYTPELASSSSQKRYIIYPLERNQNTPLDTFCMRDIMKSTLGIGPCEYIVQSEKIINSDTPHEVTNWILEITRKGQALQRQDEIKGRIKNMIEHVKQVQNRIDAYALFAQLQLSYLEQHLGDNIKDKEIQALMTTLTLIAQRANNAGSSAEYPAQATELSEKMLKQLSSEAKPETLTEFANKLSSIGETQDKAISFCRMATQWVRQLAEMLATSSPERKSIFEQIILKANSSLSAM